MRDMLPGDAKPTQRTIADATGFAVTTVSKALAGDPSIAERTRQKVQEAARALGYVPDRAAQRLRTGRTNVISLVLDPHSELLGFGSSMIEGIAEVVRSTPYHLTIMQYQLGEDPLDPIRYIVRNRLADGLIFARTEPRDARVRYLQEAEFPFITHGRTDFPGHAWYDFDNAAFAAQAVDMLADRGATHIGLLPPSEKYTFHRHMMDGFRARVAVRGCAGSVAPGADLNDHPDVLYARLHDWLSGPDAPDALICPGEVSAITAHAVISDLGTKGAHIRMVAKQTSPVFDQFRPRPLTITEDIVNAGRLVTQALLRLIDNAAPETQQILAAPV